MLGFSDLLMDRIMVDRIYNPWFDQMNAIAYSLIVFGLFFLWFHRRINDSRLYNTLGISLAAVGILLTVFGRDPVPNPYATIAFLAALSACVAGLIAIFTTLMVQMLPEMGLDEKYVHDPDSHKVRWYLAPGMVLILYALIWMFWDFPIAIDAQLVGDSKSYLVEGLLVLMTSVIAYGLLPMSYVREVALMSETAPPMELDEIFTASGPARAFEKFTVPLVSVALLGVAIYLGMHGFQLEGEDSTGAIFLFFLAIAITLSERHRVRRSEELAALEASRKRVRA